KPPCGPKRGHGSVQPRFAFEVALDEAAEKLGLDPVEARRRNFIGEFVETVNGQKITSNGFLKCLELVEKASGWKERHGKLGQGVNTLLCQIAAEELHCDPYDVTVVAADTDLTPVDLGAYSSRVTYMVGIAAREACQKLAEKLRAAGGATFVEACQRAEAAEG